MSDIKLNDSLTSDDNMGENNFFQNINNIVNLNSDDSNILDSPMPVPSALNIQPLMQSQPQPVSVVPTQPKPVIQIQSKAPVPIQVKAPVPIQVKAPVLTQVKAPVLTQVKAPVPIQPKPVVQVQPQLSEKSVTFNEVVEQKEITPISQQIEVRVDNLPLVTEIKKIKLGKFLVPRVTVLFVLVLMIIGAGLFYATKPKKLKKIEEKDNN
jgi:hypothetical protein